MPYMSGVRSSVVSERAEHRNAGGKASHGDSETLPMNTRLVEHGNRKATPDVPERVKLAAEILATTPGAPDYAAIAAAVGYTNVRMLRRALSLPQSIRYLREHKRAMVEEINMGNPERLRRIADAEGGNAMAKVAAVRGLELMQNGDAAADALRAPRQAAGITIVIETGNRAPPTIDVTPAREDEYAE